MQKLAAVMVVLLATAALGPTGVVAQEATPTPTPTEQDPAGTAFYGDSDVRITSWSFDSGTFTITFHSETEKLVTLTAAPASTGEGSSPGNVKQAWIREGETTLTMQAPTGAVWLSTSTSVANGRYTALTAQESDPIISGPYGADDVRDAAIGGAIGVMLPVLFTAVAARRGGDGRGERLA